MNECKKKKRGDSHLNPIIDISLAVEYYIAKGLKSQKFSISFLETRVGRSNVNAKFSVLSSMDLKLFSLDKILRNRIFTFCKAADGTLTFFSLLRTKLYRRTRFKNHAML